MNRTYQKTHPWLSFSFNLGQASPFFWLLLGEASAKCDHLANAPLLPELAREFRRVYLAKGAAATTAIEGNSLTEDQVQQRIEGELTLPPSKEYLGQEIDNVVAAFNLVRDNIKKGNLTLTSETINTYNRLILQNLKLEEGVVPGEYRTYGVTVGKVYRGAPPEDCPYLMDKFCQWLASDDFKPGKPALQTVYALIKAVVAHLYFEWIHPYGDGNGRTGRLLEFHILLSAGIPAPAAHLLSNHYNQTRAEYYRQLNEASRSGGNILPFLEYAISGFVDELKEQFKKIHAEQWQATWKNFVHTTFHDHEDAPSQRQKRILLELGNRTEPIKSADIPTLTPTLARIYATLNKKTVQRDIESLVEKNLVESEDGKIRARTEILIAFLPWQKSGEFNNGI